MSERENSELREASLVSSVEKDLLVRSNKKFKRKITSWIFDSNPVDGERIEEAGDAGNQTAQVCPRVVIPIHHLLNIC